MKTYALPPRFYEDHRARSLPEEGTSTVVGHKGKQVLVSMDKPAYLDLLSDADYYSDSTMFERELYGLCSSARATAKVLVEKGAPTNA